MAARTALVYDEEMTRYKLLWVDPACKVEVPERLTVSYAALKARGLAARCVALPVRGATDEDVLLVHSEEYLEAVKQTPHMDLEGLMKFTQQYGDVYFHPNIYHCATLAIGATLQLVDSVMTGKVRNGMALVRPPGHHSQRSAANGFCVFNNVAIAALYAKKHYDVKRVLIVDWDIHHGQGVQYCFEEDPSVLYFSWHRYEHQSFWPNLQESDYDTVGKGKGLGFNINLPWNKVGMNNSDYLSAFFHVLLPVAYEFSPDLVFVSAGFDSAIGDPEGHMCATPDVFAHLTHLLMSLAGGKLCAVLEGGYNLTSLPQSVCQTVQTLLGDPTPEMSGLDRPCLRCSQVNSSRLLIPFLTTRGKHTLSPGLVLVALAEGSGVDVAAWAQLTSLLQGVAQGRMLTLMQVGPMAAPIITAAASLMGEPTSALGPTGTLIPEDARVLERERKRLQGRWGLLQTAEPPRSIRTSPQLLG
uniref:Histone deacetylase domain-containing protein n=1 Tax=Denticeps clupeoides TaxID=299321 RepID=A0AAY4DW29_9TELE